jgi:Holliday junction resolvasome RuvABC endonuclease subunit
LANERIILGIDPGTTIMGFGIVWGLLIFNLDRFIVSTIRKRDRFSSEFLQATPRIILAIIIAIVI